MSSRFRPVLLALTLTIVSASILPTASYSQMNDPTTTGGTRSRHVGAVPPASPWVSLGNVLRSAGSTGFGSFTWEALRRPHGTDAEQRPRVARQLSW